MDESYWTYVEQMDAESFRRLMAAYGQDVWNLAYILTKRHDMADDITQDVFLKVYRTIGSFRGASSIRTWLFAITRNVSINYRRAAFVRKVTLTGWIAAKGSNPSAEQEALDLSLSEDIWRTVLTLPLKLREVLILHAKYELTAREIADTLQIPEGTVKSRLSRARSRMAHYRKESTVYE